jgi:hypothetical protein
MFSFEPLNINSMIFSSFFFLSSCVACCVTLDGDVKVVVGCQDMSVCETSTYVPMYLKNVCVCAFFFLLIALIFESPRMFCIFSK